MTTREGFLRAIVENPEDMSHRLIFADWLEEQQAEEHRALAELIRIDEQLAPLDDFDPRYKRLSDRREQLLEEYRQKWWGPLYDHIECLDATAFGFPEEVTLSMDNFINHGEAIFASHPIRDIVLTDLREDRFDDFCSSPWLQKIRALTFVDSVPVPFLRKLGASPGASSLRHLHFLESTIGRDGTRALFSSAHITRLESANLSWNRIGNAGVRAICEAGHLNRLCSLDLAGNNLTDRAIERMAQAPHLSGLKELSLHNNYLTGRSTAAIAQATFAPMMERLTLNWNQIGEQGIIALAESPKLTQLKLLGLRGAQVTAKALKAMANAVFAPGLEQLILAKDCFGNEGLQALLKAPFQNLKQLTLDEVGVTEEGAAALAGAQSLSTLKWLGFARNAIGPHGIEALASSPWLQNIQYLFLKDIEMNGTAVDAILNDSHWPDLICLSVSGNKLSRDDKDRLHDRFGEKCHF